MDISVEFVEIPVNSCTIRVRSINQKSGSAFDEWVRMGGLSLTEQDIDYLKISSEPKLTIRHTDIKDGKLTYSASLDPLEIMFVEIQLT